MSLETGSARLLRPDAINSRLKELIKKSFIWQVQRAHTHILLSKDIKSSKVNAKVTILISLQVENDINYKTNNSRYKQVSD